MQDVRHRFFAMVNFGLPKGMRMGIFTQGQSASPYNIITGFDNNRDTVVSDRPEGVGAQHGARRGELESERAAEQDVRLRAAAQTDGRPSPRVAAAVGGGGPGGPGGGGGGPMMMMMDGSNQRYRLEFYVQAFNILNRVNYSSFVGNLRIDNFGQPASARAGAADRTGDELRVLTGGARLVRPFRPLGCLDTL